MKKILIIAIAMLIAAPAAQSQWLKKLGEKAVERAKDRSKQKVEDKVNEKVDKTVDKVFETGENIITGNDKDQDQQTEQTSQQDKQTNQQNKQATAAVNTNDPKAVEMAYAKSDFVAGDVVIFEDNVTQEQLGEFPSMWDLREGVADVVTINGEKCINLQKDTEITPLMKDGYAYLTDEFTVELDFFNYGEERYELNDDYTLYFYQGEGTNTRAFDINLRPSPSRETLELTWNWSVGDDRRRGETEISNLGREVFNRLAISFNKRALKVYIDGVRYANVPNVTKPDWFLIKHYGYSENAAFIKNVRIAKGAVPLYDRMMTDGKFITYGITFDVGKSTIKPESMGEINRIVKLMQDNPDLKFSVEGHTDSTGNEATNQTLSDARSKAVVDKLVEMGIAADRLTSSGKGQSNPIADNGTDEGRAKNRRVEFVKM
ncbi:OmpA family protein [Parabacteroides sp. AF48-14]|uniref:OmpA family protein n=1 Tax=Parabacteroides sp. AF48-14 TaxID=2292052 RepID=UPI000EFEFBD2|nr:OmpA family protein [Parabacteroides sp. AF48-14]RHO70744.1 OmpA family protein [Parabacteroides sp. AF48-14]